MTQLYLSFVWDDASIAVTWRIHMCVMIQSCVTRLMHMRDMTYVTWLVHFCDMSHSMHYVNHLYIWLSYNKLFYLYIWRDSFGCVTWLILCHMTHSCVWHDQHAVTHCNTLHYAATHCNTLQHTVTHELNYICDVTGAFQLAIHCSTLPNNATLAASCNTMQYTVTRCNTLQHTTAHCSTLQHTTTYYNTLRHAAPRCATLQHTATRYNTLQNTATHSNTWTHSNMWHNLFICVTWLIHMRVLAGHQIYQAPFCFCYSAVLRIKEIPQCFVSCTWMSHGINFFRIRQAFWNSRLQHTATHCNTLKHTRNAVLQRTDTHCNTL